MSSLTITARAIDLTGLRLSVSGPCAYASITADVDDREWTDAISRLATRLDPDAPSACTRRRHRPARAPRANRLVREPMPTNNHESLAVVFDKVSFAFDDHVVLKEISFSVPKASMAILLGASGAGKSIILKLILGLLRPDSGTILVNGQRIDSMPERDLLSCAPTSACRSRRSRCSTR